MKECKYLSKALLSFICLFWGLSLQAQVQDLRAMMNLSVMTWNLRYDNPTDGENAWPLRKDKVFDLIREENPDLIGMQEAKWNQVKDLKKNLKEYKYIGVGRDDGKKGGEFSPIFYRKSQFKLLKSGTFWLAPDPEQVGAKGWDAALPRIVTWAKFEIIGTGKIFYHFNTHFDHQGQEARYQSALLLSGHFRKLPAKPHIILTGDFNEEPNGPVYLTLTYNGDYSFMKDARLSANSRLGPQSTFYGFEMGKSKGTLIDYIFLRRFRKVFIYKVLDNNSNGFYPSDHLPVMVNILY